LIDYAYAATIAADCRRFSLSVYALGFTLTPLRHCFALLFSPSRCRAFDVATAACAAAHAAATLMICDTHDFFAMPRGADCYEAVLRYIRDAAVFAAVAAALRKMPP